MAGHRPEPGLHLHHAGAAGRRGFLAQVVPHHAAGLVHLVHGIGRIGGERHLRPAAACADGARSGCAGPDPWLQDVPRGRRGRGPQAHRKPAAEAHSAALPGLSSRSIGAGRRAEMGRAFRKRARSPSRGLSTRVVFRFVLECG